MFDIGFAELIIIGVVALVVIGPERLPETIRTVSAWVNRLRRSFNDIKREVQQELHNDGVMQDLRKVQKDLREGTDAIRETTDALREGVSAPLKEMVSPATPQSSAGTEASNPSADNGSPSESSSEPQPDATPDSTKNTP